jgi:hypothetical protein
LCGGQAVQAPGRTGTDPLDEEIYMRRLPAAGTGVLVALVTAILLGTPARAGAFDGDVTNLIPSSSGLTVHIACFGKNCPTNTTCKVHEDVDHTCHRWWLPAGWADDGLLSKTVPAGTFYKISDIQNVTCEYIGGRAICR